MMTPDPVDSAPAAPAESRPGAAFHRCGYVALIGRPNVGKSTLLNRLVGQKLSITARKPQTTRHQILGIHSCEDHQIIFVDTPGIHRGRGRAINRYMNRAASAAIEGVDVVVFVVEALRWTPEDDDIRRRLQGCGKPLILAPNKIDRISDKTLLLPYLSRFAQWEEFADVVPVSARRGHNVERLEDVVVAHLPAGPAIFPAEQVTDRSERFLAAELIREKLTRRLGQEIPYHLTVEIEEFEAADHLVRIGAVIWVDRRGHKSIVIGKQGSVLREVGREARLDIETMLQTKVFLRLWVKVREGWSDDERALRHLGYEG